MAVCAPDVLCQPVLVDDLVAALAHGLPEVGAVVLEAVALQHLQAAELALAHQASEVRDGLETNSDSRVGDVRFRSIDFQLRPAGVT